MDTNVDTFCGREICTYKPLQFNWFVAVNGGRFFNGSHPNLTYLKIFSCDFASKKCSISTLLCTWLVFCNSWFSLLHPIIMVSGLMSVNGCKPVTTSCKNDC